jgi:HK97 family phage major capsid protein
MSDHSRRLREQRCAIHEQVQELLKKERMTVEDRARFDAMMAEMDALKLQIDQLERVDRNDLELRHTVRPPLAPIGDDPYAQASGERRHHKAFLNYLRRGEKCDPEDREVLREHRDLGSGGGNALDGSGGGYFVPVGFVNRIETALKFFGGMLQSSTIMTTATGQPLPYPISNDTSISGELVGEASSVTSGDPTLGSIVFNAFKYSTKMVKVSLELLQDSAFDLEPWLSEQFAIRLGRALNKAFTTGGGTSEPTGIINAATASGQTVLGDDNASSPDPTKEVGYIDLVNLEHSVDRLYRQNGAFMMHDSTLQFVKKLKDKYGRPIWTPGLASNSPDTLLGYGYYVNNDMDELKASGKTVLFGRLDKYLIRRVKDLAVLRLVERFAEYGQVAFLGFARYDGNLLDAGTNPVKYLVQHS